MNFNHVVIRSQHKLCAVKIMTQLQDEEQSN